jgi:putative NADH-flavin reductase
MHSARVWLVFGATGRTGRHFVSLALDRGHKVRALVRNPEKVSIRHSNLEVFQGSICDDVELDSLLEGVDFVISMLGDAALQREDKINADFVKRLIPAMRRRGVKRFLYQAGAFTRPYRSNLPLVPWLLKNTLARFNGLLGQHADNEAVVEYLVEEAQDIDWVVHRAALISDGPSKGTLKRSKTRTSLATFRDCAVYNLRILMDGVAIHTCDLSFYESGIEDS